VTRVGVGLSTARAASDAAAEAAARARSELGGAPADLAFVFLSPHHVEDAAEVVARVNDELGPACLAGCAAEGVIGLERELEDQPGLAVWSASLPGARIEPFHVSAAEETDAIVLDGLPELDDPTLVLLLVDPFALPVTAVIDHLNEEYPGIPVVGGIATGGGEPGAQALILGGEVYTEGAVGIGLADVAVQAVVSQGCAPLGSDAVITRAEGNVVLELAGRPALERLREVVGGLSAEERALAARGLLAGLVIDENKPDYGRGDFLMRGILGADEESGAIAIGEQVRVGQTLRFHARDAASATEDMRLALDESVAENRSAPAGALLFSCNGRGRAMFDEADHDSRALAGALGAPALAGFFCGGEIGPVGGRSFLHGFTATMAIFLDGGQTASDAAP
jgi:small ligand-binding sensory domain FIST